MYGNTDVEKLSPSAKQLVILVYEGKRPMSEVLVANPELMDGVDEYIKWFGATQTAIAQEAKRPAAGHGVKQAMERLKGK